MDYLQEVIFRQYLQRTGVSWALCDSGKPVTSFEVASLPPSQRGNYKCAECGEFLIFKCGNINVPHFSHRNGTTNHGGGESTIHSEAKWKVKTILESGMEIHPFKKCKKCKDSYYMPPIQLQADEKVAVEYRFIGGIADLAILDSTDKARLLIEINHTHPTSDRPIPWVELKASSVLKYDQTPNIRQTGPPVCVHDLDPRKHFKYNREFINKNNAKQSKCIDLVSKEENLLITGPGGVGKSHIIKQIMRRHYNPDEKNIALMAPTGVAAELLRDKFLKNGREIYYSGTTIHSFIGLTPVTKNGKIIYRLDKENLEKVVERAYSKKDLVIRTCEKIIIDEVSMISAEMLEFIDEVLRKVKDVKNVAFGGCQVILLGDFYQIPPVLNEDNETPVYKSWLMDCFRVEELTEPMRQSDKTFFEFLQRSRTGELLEEDIDWLETIEKRRINNFVDKNSVWVVPTNDIKNARNKKMLEELDEEIETFEPSVKVYNREWDGKRFRKGEEVSDDRLPEKIRNLVKSRERSLLDKRSESCRILTIAKGAKVMCTRNFHGNGIMNGSQGEVVESDPPRILWNECKYPVFVPKVFENDLDEEESDSDDDSDDYAKSDDKMLYKKLKKIHYKPKVYGYVVESSYYPLQLSYALTIHKCQGQTMNMVTIYAPASYPYNYGQIYTALSRVKDYKNLYIKELSPTSIKADPDVKEFLRARLEESDRETDI